MGYAVSAYTRNVAGNFLAKRKFYELKDHIFSTSIYMFVTFLILNAFVFLFANYLASLFFRQEEAILLLSQCLRLLSMFFVFEGFLNYLNSTLRMIGFENFTFYVTFIIFVVLFPSSFIFVTLTYKTGTFIAILILFSYTSLTSIIFLFRLITDFRKNVEETFDVIEAENMKEYFSASIEDTNKL